MSFIPSVLLVAYSIGDAKQLASYGQEIQERGGTVSCYAPQGTWEHFTDRGLSVSPYSLKGLTTEEKRRLAETIAKTYATAHVAIVGVGHEFAITVLLALKEHAPNVIRVCNYDNPQRWVLGGYSITAANAVTEAEVVLYANANLAELSIERAPGEKVDFTGKWRHGIGFYLLDEAKSIATARELHHDELRAKFLAEHQILDEGQAIIGYFGANNEAYFEGGFPAFLEFLKEASKQSKDLRNAVILIQQHPSAKALNRDIVQLPPESEREGMPKIIVSDFPSDKAMLFITKACYYQTSAGANFFFGKIPIWQVGPVVYDDVLVQIGMPVATSPQGFLDAFETVQAMDPSLEEALLLQLGYRKDWKKRIVDVISGHAQFASQKSTSPDWHNPNRLTPF